MKSCNLLIFFLVIAQISEILGDCGYNSCFKTDPKKLNIHVIPHSHDDVGYIKTVDGYYEEDIKHIISNVVQSLSKNSNRTFTQVEVYYFNRWWNQQNDTTKTLVNKLVNSGQLTFTNGGYCVNDEGAANYNDIIDQMTLGLRILDQLFGKCGRPLVSWQIDPFGASKEMASLYAQMGFDGHVTNRAIKPKGEFIWRGSHDLGEKSEIFTTVLHDHYGPPDGFDFETGNDITDANKNQKASNLVKIAQNWNENYGKTEHVLIPFGQDFKYKNAERWFANIDKLIEAIHETHPEVNIFYSSPSCYISSVNKQNKTFEKRDKDFLEYWTGYYTTRPAMKYQERYANNLLQVSKQLDAITGLSDDKSFLDEARNQLAILQHHDAITGTSSQIAADDYYRRLYNATKSCGEVVDKAFSKLLPRQSSTKTVHKQIVCDGLNITECSVSENNQNLTLIIYNPIGTNISQWVRIPVSSDHNYEVFDSNGVKVDKTYVIPISQSVQHLPGRKSVAKNELVFRADLLSLGFVTYFVEKTSKTFEFFNTQNNGRSKRAADHQMKGKGFILHLDSTSGNIKSIKLDNGKQFPFEQSFKYYRAHEDTAYQFCPDGNAVTLSTVKLESKYDNGFIHEVKQQWNEWISQTIRVYEDEQYVEFDWVVGPIPVDDKIGKEVITRFDTHLNNERVFFTDANGRQMVKRVRDPEMRSFSSGENLMCNKNSQNNITFNYYPVYSKIYIKDEKEGIQLSVLTDRTQGGSSLKDGQIELMVHRRILTDTRHSINELGVDGRGLVVRGKHYVFFRPIDESAKLFRDLSQRLFMQPLITFSPLTQSQTDYKNKYQTSYSAINRQLPQNVHLLTFEQWKTNQILVRFEHFYESVDNNQLSKAVEVNLENLFKSFKIISLTETTLSANQIVSETHRMKWNSNKQFSESQSTHNRNIRANTDFTIQLLPQQIRTFILTTED